VVAVRDEVLRRLLPAKNYFRKISNVTLEVDSSLSYYSGMSDSQPSDRPQSIGELADATGVSRRTVRFYVQRGLIDPPVGLGRASHYTA
jgi:hypothetical protein